MWVDVSTFMLGLLCMWIRCDGHSKKSVVLEWDLQICYSYVEGVLLTMHVESWRVYRCPIRTCFISKSFYCGNDVVMECINRLMNPVLNSIPCHITAKCLQCNKLCINLSYYQFTTCIPHSAKFWQREIFMDWLHSKVCREKYWRIVS